MCRSRGSERQTERRQRDRAIDDSACNHVRLVPASRRRSLRRARAAGAAIARRLRRPARASLDDEARQYVRLAVALGERDPDSLDFYAGPADAVADIRRSPPPLTAIKRDAEALSARHPGASRSRSGRADAGRGAGARSRGDRRARRSAAGARGCAFDQESLRFFGIAPGPIDERAPRRDPCRRSRTRVGGGGRLVDRYAAFAARFTVPRRAAAAGDGGGARRMPRRDASRTSRCRRASRRRLEFVRDKPWSAFSRYRRRRPQRDPDQHRFPLHRRSGAADRVSRRLSRSSHPQHAADGAATRPARGRSARCS